MGCRTLTPYFSSFLLPLPISNPRRCSSPFSLPPPPKSKSVSSSRSNSLQCIKNNSRWSLHCLSSSDASSSFSAAASASEFPLLPFGADEVLVPSEIKTLHLYEARYLALLEESLIRRKKFFVHFVLDPIITSSSLGGVSFAARYGCLVFIESVERLEIGALISIRGIGRVKIMNFVQADPYLIGGVVPLQDDIPDSPSEINSKVTKLKESLRQLNGLQIKLKTLLEEFADVCLNLKMQDYLHCGIFIFQPSKDELLQTQISNSLRWAEKEQSALCDKSFIPSVAERLSFAGLQPVSGSNKSELVALQREKLQAMDAKSTSERLEKTIEIAKQNISLVAAKLAIQSLEVQ